MSRDEAVEALAAHVHDQRFDGDDPYLVCKCGAIWDALTGRPLNAAARPPVLDDEAKDPATPPESR